MPVNYLVYMESSLQQSLEKTDAGRDWRQEEKGMTEDEMAGWHHWLNGRESQWTLGVGDGQGGLACCNSWGREESDTTERLNWTEPKTAINCKLISISQEAASSTLLLGRAVSLFWRNHPSGFIYTKRKEPIFLCLWRKKWFFRVEFKNIVWSFPLNF